MSDEFIKKVNASRKKAEPEAPVIERQDDAVFEREIDALIKYGEDRRLYFMKKHDSRGLMVMTLTLILVVCGAGAFGWFLLMQYNIVKAALSMVSAIFLPLLLGVWTNAPIKQYKVDYKKNFMPRMAKALEGLNYYPSRGIGMKMVARTGVIPAHDRYHAEDCFMGRYKGVKIMLSEARLYSKKKPDPIFNGIFALVELGSEIIPGHIIITADKAMATRSASTRWQKLQSFALPAPEDAPVSFLGFADQPEQASTAISETLVKELCDTSIVFGNSPLSAVFFGKKYIFLMIPCVGDMFEASEIFTPVTTRQHAMKCKREIDKILEVIDVFMAYAPEQSA